MTLRLIEAFNKGAQAATNFIAATQRILPGSGSIAQNLQLGVPLGPQEDLDAGQPDFDLFGGGSAHTPNIPGPPGISGVSGIKNLVGGGAQAITGGIDSMAQAIQKAMGPAQQLSQSVAQLAVTGLVARNRMTDFFVDIADNSKTAKEAFADFARGFIRDMSGMIAEVISFRIVAGFLGGAFGSTGTAAANVIQPIGNPFFTQSEMGNVFANGNVQPFAAGGIIGSKKFFPMAGGGLGSVAEKREEAFMPLERDSAGRLSVLANGDGGGGSPTIVMNISALDTQTGIGWVMENSEAVGQALVLEMSKNPTLKAALQTVGIGA